MVHFFDMEQTPAYGGLCYSEGGNYGREVPTSKVTTPLAYIDDIINDLIQIFMVNKKSCGNLRMCVNYLLIHNSRKYILLTWYNFSSDHWGFSRLRSFANLQGENHKYRGNYSIRHLLRDFTKFVSTKFFIT